MELYLTSLQGKLRILDCIQMAHKNTKSSL
jgi:hypothetical protein